jgi:hypothetical protein
MDTWYQTFIILKIIYFTEIYYSTYSKKRISITQKSVCVRVCVGGGGL